jgi:hypothetical protein
LNIDLKLDIAKLRQIAIDLKARIVECGRDHAVPKVTPRQQVEPLSFPSLIPLKFSL